MEFKIGSYIIFKKNNIKREGFIVKIKDDFIFVKKQFSDFMTHSCKKEHILKVVEYESNFNLSGDWNNRI